MCRDGGIGIRNGLKIHPPSGVAGSSPAPGTKLGYTRGQFLDIEFHQVLSEK